MNQVVYDKVLDLLVEFWNVPRERIRPETELEAPARAGGMSITGDDAIEFMRLFSERFEVDMTDYKHSRFFEPEPGPIMMMRRLLFPKKRVRLPITILVLVRTAEQRKWTDT
jgi:hypothetical protein